MGRLVAQGRDAEVGALEPLAFRQRPDSVLPVRFFALGLLGLLLLNAGLALAPNAIRWRFRRMGFCFST